MSLEQQVIDLTRLYNALKAQVDGLVKPEVGRWRNWTPTVDQGEAIGISIDYAKYIVLAQTVVLYTELTVTSVVAPGGDISVAGIPSVIAPALTLASGFFPFGWVSIADFGTATYHGVACPISSTTVKFRQATTGFVGSNPAFSLAASDVISFGAVYERA